MQENTSKRSKNIMISWYNTRKNILNILTKLKRNPRNLRKEMAKRYLKSV